MAKGSEKQEPPFHPIERVSLDFCKIARLPGFMRLICREKPIQ